MREISKLGLDKMAAITTQDGQLNPEAMPTIMAAYSVGVIISWTIGFFYFGWLLSSWFVRPKGGGKEDAAAVVPRRGRPCLALVGCVRATVRPGRLARRLVSDGARKLAQRRHRMRLHPEGQECHGQTRRPEQAYCVTAMVLAYCVTTTTTATTVRLISYLRQEIVT